MLGKQGTQVLSLYGRTGAFEIDRAGAKNVVVRRVGVLGSPHGDAVGARAARCRRQAGDYLASTAGRAKRRGG
jgi:hypothetical protein